MHGAITAGLVAIGVLGSASLPAALTPPLQAREDCSPVEQESDPCPSPTQPMPRQEELQAWPKAPATEPNLNPTQIPSALVAEWGDYYVAGYVYGYETGNGSNSFRVDGGASVGMGFGNARQLVAVEVGFNLESLANANNGGTLDVRLGRQLIGTDTFALHVGAGWLGVVSYGDWPPRAH